MDIISNIAIISLAIGILCTCMLTLHERKEFMERKTYKIVSIISFAFNMTGGILCLFMLSV